MHGATIKKNGHTTFRRQSCFLTEVNENVEIIH